LRHHSRNPTQPVEILIKTTPHQLDQYLQMPRGLGLLLSIGLPLLLYWLTLPRALTLEDAGLFQMVCHEGGISHPPGYPLFTMVCQGFVGLTWFDNPIIPANLLSAIFAAGACGMLFLIAECLGITRIYAVIVALAYGFSNAFWSQAIIVEVYSLGALTFLVCFYFGLCFGNDGRRIWLYCLAFSFGLALSNHWPLIILSSPAILLLLFHQWPRFLACLKSPLFWLVSLGLLILGLTPYLSLLQVNPEIAIYGANQSWSDLVRYIDRSVYADTKQAATLWDKWQFSIWLWQQSAQQLSYVCLPIVLIGVWQSFRIWPRFYALSLVLLYLGTTQILNLLLGFTFEYRFQSVFHPYPLLAYASLAIWLGVGAFFIARWIATCITARTQPKAVATYLVVALSLALPASTLMSHYGQNNRANSEFVELYGETILYALPENSVLFTYGDFEVAVLGYLQRMKGIRPDIEIREWYNLVLPNRLASPWASPEEQDRVRTAYIEAQTRPVFSVRQWNIKSVNHGLFYRIDSSADNRSRYLAGFEPLLDLTLKAYQEGLFWNAQEHELAYSLLAKFGRHYTELLLDNESLPTTVVPRYEAIRQTLPGELATLEALAVVPDGGSAKQVLLPIAEALLQHESEGLYRKDIAKLYDIYGYILGLAPADEAASQAAFQKSYDVYPSSDGTAYCKLAANKASCDKSE
jgi:hypothetical protein